MPVLLASVLTIFMYEIAQAEDCLRRERERVSQYLHTCTEQKLVEVSANVTISCFHFKILLDEAR